MTKAIQEVTASAREALGELQKSTDHLNALIQALEGLPASAPEVGRRAAAAAGCAAGALKACTTVAGQAVNLAVASGLQSVAAMVGDVLVRKKE